MAVAAFRSAALAATGHRIAFIVAVVIARGGGGSGSVVVWVEAVCTEEHANRVGDGAHNLRGCSINRRMYWFDHRTSARRRWS